MMGELSDDPATGSDAISIDQPAFMGKPVLHQQLPCSSP
jgi:hypothetical protein